MVDKKPHQANILILGGINEAVKLTELLYDKLQVLKQPARLIYSIAGLTKKPNLPYISDAYAADKAKGLCIVINDKPFGGLAGLCKYIIDNEVGLIINATQPYTEQISQNAYEAALITNTIYLRFMRKEWERLPGDSWIYKDDIVKAIDYAKNYHLGILLATGVNKLWKKNQKKHGKKTEKSCKNGQDFPLDFSNIKPAKIYLRSISKPDEKLLIGDNFIWVKYNSQNSLADEVIFLQNNNIDVVISKNSGGEIAYRKIEAARKLKLPVIMIKRKDKPKGQNEFSDINQLIDAAMRARLAD